ncbi:hypothetical protein [Pseudonocardia sp. ICBG601]|uniref:hypothetical protein n=1 Tax=Pseudonocardia sp. ICBG601 TaxID=2846759 RepID=UPI001CF662D0|nr:hypothetical protein [Pseudonocardia sp. ICBG601]
MSDAEPEPDGTPATHLEISLTVDVDMPLSRLAAPVVTRTMKATMDVTGGPVRSEPAASPGWGPASASPVGVVDQHHHPPCGASGPWNPWHD